MNDKQKQRDGRNRRQTPRDAARAQVAAFRRDMSEGWNWTMIAELAEFKASIAAKRQRGVRFLVDPEPHARSQALGAKYDAAPEIEWDGTGPHQYVIQLGPIVRIAGQLSGSDFVGIYSAADPWASQLVLGSARMEYQEESTPWLELPLDADEQQAVNEFVTRLLNL